MPSRCASVPAVAATVNRELFHCHLLKHRIRFIDASPKLRQDIIPLPLYFHVDPFAGQYMMTVSGFALRAVQFLTAALALAAMVSANDFFTVPGFRLKLNCLIIFITINEKSS